MYELIPRMLIKPLFPHVLMLLTLNFNLEYQAKVSFSHDNSISDRDSLERPVSYHKVLAKTVAENIRKKDSRNNQSSLQQGDISFPASPNKN